MVLIDTNIWIHFLANRLPFAEDVEGLLKSNYVVGHPLVYVELLMGDIGGRVKFLGEYGRIIHATKVPHDEVVRFVRDRKLHGRGVGWIDVNLLASAVVDGLQLWTADPRLNTLASEFGLAYIPSG